MAREATLSRLFFDNLLRLIWPTKISPEFGPSGICAAKEETPAAHRLRGGADCRPRFVVEVIFFVWPIAIVNPTGTMNATDQLNVGRWTLSVGRFLL